MLDVERPGYNALQKRSALLAPPVAVWESKPMRPLVSASLLLPMAVLCGCEAGRLDRQMDELCKKDGGVTVHETVELPPSAFDARGRLVTGKQQRLEGGVLSESVGSEYSIEHQDVVIKAGDPFSGVISQGRLLRHVVVVRRIADGKVLGAEITYGRTGGDMTLGHPSQNFCPKPRPTPGVVGAVFVKGE